MEWMLKKFSTHKWEFQSLSKANSKPKIEPAYGQRTRNVSIPIWVAEITQASRDRLSTNETFELSTERNNIDSHYFSAHTRPFSSDIEQNVIHICRIYNAEWETPTVWIALNGLSLIPIIKIYIFSVNCLCWAGSSRCFVVFQVIENCFPASLRDGEKNKVETRMERSGHYSWMETIINQNALYGVPALKLGLGEFRYNVVDFSTHFLRNFRSCTRREISFCYCRIFNWF